MTSRILKLLISFLCIFCIAFCNVSATQPQQEQSFNAVLQKVLVNAPDIEIPKTFQSVAFKTVVKSEVLGGKSNQNEFHGTRTLRDIFGDEKQKFETTYIYLSDDKPVIARATSTWYISRYQNGNPCFRLYYRKTPVIEAMKEGDLLLLGKVDNERLFMIVVAGNSSAKDRLIASLNNMKPTKESVSIRSTASWYQVFFTPGTDCEDNIIARINKAKTIDIAVYSITNDNIANAIIAAHKRGAKVRIITDRQQHETGKYSKVQELANAGIPVRVNPVEEDKNSKYKIEHNKFAIFDGKEIESGSYNWTYNATNCNSENCMFFKQTGKDFSDRYEYLWKTYAP